MGISNITTCLNCGKTEKKYNTTGKYCSNLCQKKHQSKTKYELWKEGKSTIGKGCLRTNLIEEYGYKCSVCEISEWMNKPISLEIDHEDGDPFNNTPSNLRLICPNCHSQTLSYKGKNKGKGRSNKRGWTLENQSIDFESKCGVTAQ